MGGEMTIQKLQRSEALKEARMRADRRMWYPWHLDFDRNSLPKRAQEALSKQFYDSMPEFNLSQEPQWKTEKREKAQWLERMLKTIEETK